MAGRQMECFSCQPGAGEALAPVDAANFGHAIGSIDAHQRLPATNPACRLFDQNEEQRIIGLRSLFQPWLEFVAACRRVFGKIAEPIASVRNGGRREQAIAVARGIQRLEPNITPLESGARWRWPR